jgi:hypothetical protein
MQTAIVKLLIIVLFSAPSTLLGSVNLLSYYGMDSAYNKFCGPKKLREELSAFLPHLPGNIDSAAAHDDTNMSSLKKLITRQTICSELAPLSANALAGFRLNPGPVGNLSCVWIYFKISFCRSLNHFAISVYLRRMQMLIRHLQTVTTVLSVTIVKVVNENIVDRLMTQTEMV